MKRLWFSLCGLTINEPTWLLIDTQFSRATLYHTIKEVISCIIIDPGSHHLPQDAAMLSAGRKVTPHKSCWLASSFLGLLLVNNFYEVWPSILLTSWLDSGASDGFLYVYIIVQLITSLIVWYKRCLILKEHSVFYLNSQLLSGPLPLFFDVLIIILASNPPGFWMISWPSHNGATVVATQLIIVITLIRGRISDQLQSGCVRELYLYHCGVRSVTTAGRSLPNYVQPQKFPLLLNWSQRVKFMLIPLSH